MVRPLGIIMPATKSVFKCKGGALPLLLPQKWAGGRRFYTLSLSMCMRAPEEPRYS